MTERLKSESPNIKPWRAYVIERIDNLIGRSAEDTEGDRRVLASFLPIVHFNENESMPVIDSHIQEVLQNPDISSRARGELEVYAEFVQAALNESELKEREISDTPTAEDLVYYLKDGGDGDIIVGKITEPMRQKTASIIRDYYRATGNYTDYKESYEYGRAEALFSLAMQSERGYHHFSRFRDRENTPECWPAVLELISQRENSNDIPTVEEIAAALGIDDDTAQKVISALATYIVPDRCVRDVPEGENPWRTGYNLSPRGKNFLKLININEKARTKAGLAPLNTTN
jgi:hypothetical protein